MLPNVVLAFGCSKPKHRRALLSGAVTLDRFHTGGFLVGFVVGRLNLECPQQDRTDEREDGGDSEHIQLQGKVHGSASLVDVVKR